MTTVCFGHTALSVEIMARLPVTAALYQRKRREDAEHEAAGRGGGVDLRALTGEHPQRIALQVQRQGAIRF